MDNKFECELITVSSDLFKSYDATINLCFIETGVYFDAQI